MGSRTGHALWDDDSDNGGPSNAAPQEQRTVLPDLDPNWINLDTIHTWLTICTEEHQCAEYPKFGSPPTWLIDVQQDCLVSSAQLPGDARYYALSYVWGQVKTSKLTKATRDAFCRPGAFSTENPTDAVVIPKTVRHTMGLVKELGEKYLWVDSLCIVQDDANNFHAELRNMCGIYDRAYLTIVAATAWDADDGLRGLRGITRRRQVAANHADDLNKYANPDCMIWNSRGWCYQEAQFSRRMAMFCDQTIIWKCLCSTMSEVGESLADESSGGYAFAGGTLLLRGNPPSTQETPEGTPSKAPLAATRKTRLWDSFRQRIQRKTPVGEGFVSVEAFLGLGRESRRKNPWSPPPQSNIFRQFEQYCFHLVSPYNTRNFTQASDIPRAFEGLAQALTENPAPGSLFSQGLFWGLPVAHLQHALTWCSGEEVLRPRDQVLNFPSWSWMAWEGIISPEREHRGKVEFPQQLNFVPMCDCQWDIVQPSSELTLTHIPVSIPSYSRRAEIKITGEMCRVGAGGWTHHAAASEDEIGYWEVIYEPAAPGRPVGAVLFPDGQFDGLKGVDLLGITVFYARYDDRTPGAERYPSFASRYIKALWVVPSDGDSVSGATALPTFKRRGMAIVRDKDWARGRHGTVTVLLE